MPPKSCAKYRQIVVCDHHGLRPVKGRSLHTSPVIFVGCVRHTLFQRPLRYVPAHNDLSATETGKRCQVDAVHDERGRSVEGIEEGEGRREDE